MKRLIITENSGMAILPDSGVDMEVTDSSGKRIESIEVRIEDKDLKNKEMIRKDAVKKLRKMKGSPSKL